MRSQKSFLIMFLLISVSPMFAQKDSLSLTNQFQVNLVNGFSFSYLHLLSNTDAIRYKTDIGLSLSSENNERRNTTEYPSSLSTFDYDEDISSNSQNISLSVQYLSFYSFGRYIEVYFGAGPFVGFGRSESSVETKPVGLNASQSISSNYNKSQSYAAGLNGVAGVMCTLTEKIYFLAEYNLYISYEWKKQSNENGYIAEVDFRKNKLIIDSKSWNLNLSNIKLGIGFKF